MATDIKRDAGGGYVQRTLDSHRIFRQRDNYSMESHDLLDTASNRERKQSPEKINKVQETIKV